MSELFTLGPHTTIAVFGGTGFLGSYVVKALVDSRVRVRVISRNIKDGRVFGPMGQVGQVALVQGDGRNEASLSRLIQGCQGVVNLVGILYEKKSSTFEDIHHQFPKKLAKCARDLGVKRLVHVSALGADVNSPSSYAKTKALGEKAVLKAFGDATILRPSVIFGPEDSFFNRFARMASLMPVLPIVGGKTRFQPVYVNDVARACVAALGRQDAKGKTYALGGPDIKTFQQLMKDLLLWMGKSPRVMDIPLPVASMMARLGEWLPEPPLTRDQVKLLQTDNCVPDGMAGLGDLGIDATCMQAIVPSYCGKRS